MLYLLHGENVGASREALLGLKRNYSSDSISVFDAKKFDEDEFVRTCGTPSLLSDRRLVVIEGIKKETPLQGVSFTNTDVVFWLGEELKSSHKLFKLVKAAGGQIRHFKPIIPKHVFGFLDALGYKNRQKAFLELHRLLDQGEAPLYLLTMIVWQVRNLLSVKCLPPSGGSRSQSVKGMNPFVRRKTQGQIKNFEEGELVGIFKDLLEAEVALKTTQQDPKLILDLLVGSIISNI